MAKLSQPIRKCLVTGGAGFIGSHLVEHLLQSGYQVRVLDNFSSGKLENLSPHLSSIELVKGDIRDADLVRSACEGVQAILHHAAIASVHQSIIEPVHCHDVNVNGTLQVLNAAHEAGVEKVLFASSAAVYGQDAQLPKQEAMAPDPISPYGLHKLMGEQYCRMYAQLYALNTVCFRYFNVFGPRQDSRSQYSGVISIFIDTVLSGKNPIIYGDGKQSRDFIHVSDICRANLLALEGAVNGFEVMNVGRGSAHNLLELTDFLRLYSGRNFSIEYREDRRGDLRHSVADIAKIQKLLGFSPKMNFQAGLEQLIQYTQDTEFDIFEHAQARESA